MDIILGIVLTLLNLVLLITVIFGLPGTWLMIGAAAVAGYLWAPGMFSMSVLMVAISLALVGEILEAVTGLLGAAKAGGGWRANTAALVGGLLGGVAGTFLLPLPLIGTLLGACAGAGLAAGMSELRRGRPRTIVWRVGYGAGLGRLLGTVAKFIMGIIIFIMLTVAAFWP